MLKSSNNRISIFIKNNQYVYRQQLYIYLDMYIRKYKLIIYIR